jgi:hypothetical protein
MLVPHFLEVEARKSSRYSDYAKGWRTEKLRFDSRQRKDSFALLQFFLEPTQHIQWEPRSLLRGKAAEALSLTTQLQLMSRLRISGSIPSLPHMPSCRNHRDNFTFILLTGRRYYLLKIHGSQVSWWKAVKFIALIIANRTVWTVFPFSLLHNCRHAETLRRFEGADDIFRSIVQIHHIPVCSDGMSTVPEHIHII